MDDDGDTLIDCEDDDCWGFEGCNNPDGEHDCGNAWDDDMDNLTDCMDPDCDDSILCQQNLPPCVTHVPFVTNFGQVFYYKDIYQSGVTPDCDNNRYCGIRPEVSMVPHCYPQVATGLATAYQPCAGMTCGPGMVCLPPDPDSQELCLPLCAPGHNTQCIGSDGVCYIHWTNNFDNHIDKEVELWTCGRPQCDPMNVGNNGCNPTTAGCYPSTDLFGEATCVFPAGMSPTDGPCPNGDHDCLPGNVCRMDADSGESMCKALCFSMEQCTPFPGTTCRRDDSRQLYGYCM
jgi:hypothetical protein